MSATLRTATFAALVSSFGSIPVYAAEPAADAPARTEPAAGASATAPVSEPTSAGASSAPASAVSEGRNPSEPLRREPPPPVAPERVVPPVRARALPPDRTVTPEDSGVEEDDGALGTRQTHFYATLGVRALHVSSSGFDAFASDDVLTHVSAAFGRVLWAEGLWSVALGAAWDVGGSEEHARGLPSSVVVHRLTLAPEIRYHLLPRLYAFGRVGAGLSSVHATLDDRVAGSERSSDGLAATADPGAGLVFEIFGPRPGDAKRVRAWGGVDGGFVWTSATDLVFEGEGLPARADSIELGELSLTGAYARLNVALTF